MKKTLIGTALVVVVSGAAAATLGGMSWLDSLGLRGETKLVASRVNAYWQARKQGNLERMAVYLHPLQAALPEPGMLVTEDYELHEVEVDGERAVATLTVQSRLKHPVLSSRERSIEMRTPWVKYEGRWYLDVSPANIYDAIKAHQGAWTPPTAKAPSTDVDVTTVQ